MLPWLHFVITPRLECWSAPTAQDTVVLGTAQLCKGNLCPRGGRWPKSAGGAGETLQPRAERGWQSTGGAGGCLGCCWQRGSSLPARLQGGWVLALATVYGFRENISERNAELGSCTSAEFPAQGNCFHSHFWVCRQSWSCANGSNSSKVKCVPPTGAWMCPLPSLTGSAEQTEGSAQPGVSALPTVHTQRKGRLRQVWNPPSMKEPGRDGSVPKRPRVMKSQGAGKCWYYFIIVNWREPVR